MRKIKLPYKVLIVVLILLVGILLYSAPYSVSEKDILSYIENNLNMENGSIKVEAKSQDGKLGAILFKDKSDSDKFNLAIIEKGINNKFMIDIWKDIDTFTTYHENTLFGGYIIEAGNNKDGKISYIIIESEDGESLRKIDVKKGYFVNVFKLNKSEFYNFYNINEEVIDH